MMMIAIREKENLIRFKTTMRTMMPELLVLLFSLLFSLDGYILKLQEIPSTKLNSKKNISYGSKSNNSTTSTQYIYMLTSQTHFCVKLPIVGGRVFPFILKNTQILQSII